MVKLKKEEKVKVLSSLTEMFRNKESIIKAFNEIKN
jgi:hypothetical protein